MQCDWTRSLRREISFAASAPVLWLVVLATVERAFSGWENSSWYASVQSELHWLVSMEFEWARRVWIQQWWTDVRRVMRSFARGLQQEDTATPSVDLVERPRGCDAE